MYLSDNDHGSDVITGGFKTMVRPVPQDHFNQIPFFSLQKVVRWQTPRLRYRHVGPYGDDRDDCQSCTNRGIFKMWV